MRITLSTVRVPALEKALRAGEAQDAFIEGQAPEASGVSSAASWTLQYPAAVKAKRPRTRKKKGDGVTRAAAENSGNAGLEQPSGLARDAASESADATSADQTLPSGAGAMDIAEPAILARATGAV